MNDQSFRTVFGEYITAPQLLETLGDCTVESVQLNMDSRAMTVRLRPAALLPSEEIFAAEELLRGALQLQRAQLFPHYAPELLTADAMPSVVAFLRRENMAVNGTFDDAVYAIEGNTLTVTLAHGGKSVLAATRVEGQLTALIVRLFDRRVQVVIIGMMLPIFLEGAAGAGAPAAIAAPFLVALGFNPTTSIAIALLGDAPPASFGGAGLTTINGGAASLTRGMPPARRPPPATCPPAVAQLAWM